MISDSLEHTSRGRTPPEAGNYRAFVGPLRSYDLVSAMQFSLLTFLGLREYQSLLDIGCGSLRAGKLFIPYLQPGNYFGIEPEQWLIDEGIRSELGEGIIHIKQPTFSNDGDFKLSVFGSRFDFLLAHSIFSHASQQQIGLCLSEAAKVMKSSSVFAATFMQGETDYEGSEWVYPGCVTYTLSTMIDLVERHDLLCQPLDWPHPNRQTWIAVVRPDNSEGVPDISDVANLSRLQSRVRSCEERLFKIESHPYVRLGLKVRQLLQRLVG